MPPEPRPPRRTEDLTPEWFSELLDTRVSSVELEKIGIFSSELWRAHLGYASDPGGRPESLVLKRSAEGHADRVGERFAHEVRFYRELSRRVPVRTPRFFAGGADSESEYGYLLVEDIRQIGETDWLEGPSDEHALLAVSALARMHAAWRGGVDELDWIPHFGDPALLASFEATYRRGWSTVGDLLIEIVPEFARLGDRLLGNIVASHLPLADDATLLHGDAHAENLPLVDAAGGGREIVILDWAGPRRGSCGVDLGFFIAMSFPAGRRSQVERTLVEHHTRVLRAHGMRSAADPWLAYRRGVLRRVARIIGEASGWDPSSMAGLKMIFHRCARAAVELRVEELIP